MSHVTCEKYTVLLLVTKQPIIKPIIVAEKLTLNWRYHPDFFVNWHLKPF